MRRLTALPNIARLWAASHVHFERGLSVHIKVADGLLESSTDGRISLMFAPGQIDALEDTDVTLSSNKFLGKNVFHLVSGDTVTLSAGSGTNTRLGVYGWPNVSLDEVPAGGYTVQAFLNMYMKRQPVVMAP